MELQEAVIAQVRAVPGSTPEEIGAAIQIDVGRVRIALDALASAGRVRRLESGGYVAGAAPGLDARIPPIQALIDAGQYAAAWERIYSHDYDPVFHSLVDQLERVGQRRPYGPGIRVIQPVIRAMPPAPDLTKPPVVTPKQALPPPIRIVPPTDVEIARAHNEGKRWIGDQDGWRTVPIEQPS